jgi:hypothetical protein
MSPPMSLSPLKSLYVVAVADVARNEMKVKLRRKGER